MFCSPPRGGQSSCFGFTYGVSHVVYLYIKVLASQLALCPFTGARGFYCKSLSQQVSQIHSGALITRGLSRFSQLTLTCLSMCSHGSQLTITRFSPPASLLISPPSPFLLVRLVHLQFLPTCVPAPLHPPLLHFRAPSCVLPLLFLTQSEIGWTWLRLWLKHCCYVTRDVPFFRLCLCVCVHVCMCGWMGACTVWGCIAIRLTEI